MSKGRELFERYLQQRDAMDEGPVVLGQELKQMTRAHDGQTVRPSDRPSSRGVGRSKGGKWQDGAPEIPGPGIVVPPPASDLFTADELAGRDLEGWPSWCAHVRAAS